MTANNDVNVSFEDSKFDGITVKARIKTISFETLKNRDDDSLVGQGVRVSFAFDEPAVCTDGDIKQPGYVFRPFPFRVKPAESDAAKAKQQREFDLRDLAKIAVAAGTLKKAPAYNMSAIIQGVSEAEGALVLLKLTLDKKGYQKFDVSAAGR